MDIGRQNDPDDEGAADEHMPEDGNAMDDPEYEGLSDSDSDSDYMEDEADASVKDKLPPHNPEIVYDKADPPWL